MCQCCLELDAAVILNENCDVGGCFLIEVFVVVVVIVRGGVIGGGGLQGRGATKTLLEGGTWTWRWRRREMALRGGLVIGFYPVCCIDDELRELWCWKSLYNAHFVLRLR